MYHLCSSFLISLATTRIKVNVSSENIPPTEFFSIEAIISTEKTTFDEATSTPVKTSMNQKNTKEALHTTDVKRTTKAMTTSSLLLATTEETSLTSVQSAENLSTISVHRNYSQTTLPEKKTKGNIDYIPSKIVEPGISLLLQMQTNLWYLNVHRNSLKATSRWLFY
ncbi:unnamed protein product [Mytilus coruscus]|uniref:Uncharacterized protein n=1 Tax=Mytilus coruscus TaxID=42192 RepID=A0A6J8BVB3_MYTCO|nr:unnamed protein product [Mytilus coruscus]